MPLLQKKKFIALQNNLFTSPRQEIEFVDGPDGEKIFIDSHGGKHKIYKYNY
ncbi:MAG: hypothetical protein KGD64_04740 [Candidatus Heimdallarchaeota archaeon]|nr:hypothetical protein [Candidatus Heimdallarchaeota archaeon]